MYGQTLQAMRETGSVLLMSGERAEGQLIDRIYPEPFPPGRGRFIRRGVPPHIIQVAQTKPAQPKPAQPKPAQSKPAQSQSDVRQGRPE
jgi:S-DNA-T family DNA segregation ATPase FtsK/SpoIIIE